MKVTNTLAEAVKCQMRMVEGGGNLMPAGAF